MINCLYKHKFYDFIVIELDQNQQPLVISQLEDPFAEKTAFYLNQLGLGNSKQPQIITRHNYDEVKHLFTPKTGDFEDLDKFLLEQKMESTFDLQLVDSVEKDDRRRIHQCFKTNLQIETKALENCIKLIFHQNKFVPRPNERFLHFTLAKQGIDTHNAIEGLLKHLPHQSKLKQIDYCGLKDKRGVTIQRCSCYAIWPGFLIRAAQLFNEKDGSDGVKIQLSDFEFSKTQLNLGKHGGNQFRIVLRNVSDQESLLANLKKNQVFKNRFGYQRFGTAAIPTDQMGWYLMMQDFRSAALANIVNDLCLRHIIENDQSDLEVILFELLSKPENLDKLNNYMNTLFDKLQLKTLKTESFDIFKQQLKQLEQTEFKNYLMLLKRNVRMLFFHAFQSRIFNQMVNEFDRSELMIGDLVEYDSNVVEVSTENIQNCDLSQLVFPLIGYDSSASELAMSPIFQRMFELAEVKDVVADKDFLAPGNFRKVFAEASGLKSAFVQHSDFDQEIAPHCFNTIQLDMLPIAQATTSAKTLQYLSAVLEFSLENSCYATEFIGSVTGLVGGQLEQLQMELLMEEQ